MSLSAKQQEQKQKNKSVTMRNVYLSQNAPKPKSQHSLDRKYIEWLAKTNKHINNESKITTPNKNKNAEVIDVSQDYTDEYSNSLFENKGNTSAKSPSNKSRKMSFFHRS